MRDDYLYHKLDLRRGKYPANNQSRQTNKINHCIKKKKKKKKNANTKKAVIKIVSFRIFLNLTFDLDVTLLGR